VASDQGCRGTNGSELLEVPPEVGVPVPVAYCWRRPLRVRDLRRARTRWRPLPASCQLALGSHFYSGGHGPRSAVSARSLCWGEANEAELGLVSAVATGGDRDEVAGAPEVEGAIGQAAEG